MARKLVPKNKLYVGDNLDVMHGMNGCTVDLIYLDPPPVRVLDNGHRITCHLDAETFGKMEPVITMDSQAA